MAKEHKSVSTIMGKNLKKVLQEGAKARGLTLSSLIRESALFYLQLDWGMLKTIRRMADDLGIDYSLFLSRLCLYSLAAKEATYLESGSLTFPELSELSLDARSYFDYCVSNLRQISQEKNEKNQKHRINSRFLEYWTKEGDVLKEKIRTSEN